MKAGIVVIISMFLIARSLPSAAGASKRTSELWGERGENWSAESRLPFFGFAGYHCGDDPLPDRPVVADVTDFGAEADDRDGDSVAFQAAIDSAENGAVWIPPGKYILDQPVFIKKSGVVLRGAGPKETILYIPRSLQDLNPVEANIDGKRS